MYNHGKPHHALNKMTPVQYRLAGSLDFGNNPTHIQSYFPKSKEKNHYQICNVEKQYENMSNQVNVI